MQERFNDISVLRCCAMLMIVFYHCICPYGVWTDASYSVDFHVPLWDVFLDLMRNIHLPIFFVLAGYLYGYKRYRGGYNNFVKFIQKKFLRVMVPYILVGFLIVFVQKQPVYSLLYGISHLWFLMTIFECYIAGRLIDGILKGGNKYKLLFLLFCFVLIAIQGRCSINIWGLTIKQFCQYFPFYAIGMILGSFNLNRHELVRVEVVATICSLLIMIVIAVFFKIDGLLRILGLIFVVSIFALFRNYSNINISATTISLDKCSMGIYIVHHILIQEMNRINYFYHLMKTNIISYPIIQFIVITAVSWLIVYILKKNSWGKYLVG